MARSAANTVQIDVQGLDAALADLADVPKGIDRARRRAASKLATFAKRQVAQIVAQSIGMPQKNLLAIGRLSTKRTTDGALEVWIGTNPIDAQYLGAVSWKRSWKGAKAGRRQFPGSWSWAAKAGAKTGEAIMYRTDGRRDHIAPVKVPVHDLIKARLGELSARLSERYQKIMAQELRYALTVERRKGRGA